MGQNGIKPGGAMGFKNEPPREKSFSKRNAGMGRS